MVIYENGQYDSRYFGENVSIVDASSYIWVNSPKVEFKSNHIELTASGTYYWKSRTTYFKFIDALIAENSEVWVTMEITNVNNYYSFTRVLNSDPYPYDPSASGSAQYIQAEGNTVSGRYKIAGRNSDGNLQLIIMLDNNGSYTYKITKIEFEPYIPPVTSNGGGATHIAKRTGQLKDLSSYTSDILMVSGGGGGGLLVGDTDYSGKEAGGISGSGDNSADQTTGNAFGQGESGTNVSGGGSGLYGGYKGTSSKSGGAGSGYIGNSLVSNKKMVGYNVPTSSAEGTKTESINEVSASAVSGKPKSGNGFARIKFLRESNWRCLESIEVDGVDCPLLQINDFSIIPNTYGGAETLIRRQSGIYTPSGVSDLGSEFAQPAISSGTVEKSTNYNNVIFRTTFGYNAQAYSNFNQNEIIYNTNTVLMAHGFLLATERNTRLYIGIALNDAERYGCCYFVAQYPDRNWTTESYSGGDGEIGYLIYSIFGNS